MEIQEVAAEAAKWFETAKRPGLDVEDDGLRFTRTKDNAPEWIGEMCHEAHGPMLPDDWRYDCIRAAVDWIAEGNDSDDSGEFADGQVDAYTSARLDWLGSSAYRQGYVDEAIQEFGGGRTSDGEYGRGGGEVAGIVDMIGMGQYAEAGEVFGYVLSALEERLEAVEAELEDAILDPQMSDDGLTAA
jgi:hypothetical protein